jgi:hypothetical protein
MENLLRLLRCSFMQHFQVAVVATRLIGRRRSTRLGIKIAFCIEYGPILMNFRGMTYIEHGVVGSPHVLHRRIGFCGHGSRYGRC